MLKTLLTTGLILASASTAFADRGSRYSHRGHSHGRTSVGLSFGFSNYGHAQGSSFGFGLSSGGYRGGYAGYRGGYSGYRNYYDGGYYAPYRAPVIIERPVIVERPVYVSPPPVVYSSPPPVYYAPPTYAGPRVYAAPPVYSAPPAYYYGR